MYYVEQNVSHSCNAYKNNTCYFRGVKPYLENVNFNLIIVHSIPERSEKVYVMQVQGIIINVTINIYQLHNLR